VTFLARGVNRVTEPRRYRLDDLRHYVSALTAAAGVAPARASALATLLLWFDAAGAPPHGIATLPDLLHRIDAGEVDPKAEGTVKQERPATAVLDGGRGVPLLVLERAAGLAAEKARDCGVGLVRVENTGATGSAAGIAAEAAIGPVAALVLGPDARWAVALPSDAGLPAVFDPALAGDEPVKAGRGRAAAGRQAVDALIGPWAAALAPGRGWLVAAVSGTAMGPLSAFHAQVAGALQGVEDGGGRLLPGPWETRRREARERGVTVNEAAWTALATRAETLGVKPPAP